MPKFDNAPLQIRFIGESLGRNAVPIYELGVTLVAMQRMVHKAYLVDQGQEKARPFLSFDERQRLALQLVARKKASDGYGLGPILSDPAACGAIGGYGAWVLQALTQYVKGKVTGRKKKKQSPEEEDLDVFTGVIYNQVAELTGRIQNIGGVEAIELATPQASSHDSVTLDASTKKYVREIRDEVAYGPVREIQGVVLDLSPGDTSVKAKVDSRIVKILLDQQDFDLLRYKTGSYPRVQFLGEPVYKLGREVYAFEHFEASQVTILNDGQANG